MFRDVLMWSIPATDLYWDGWACYEAEGSGDLRLQFWIVDSDSPISGLGMECNITGYKLKGMRPRDLATFLNNVRMDVCVAVAGCMGNFSLTPLYSDAFSTDTG